MLYKQIEAELNFISWELHETWLAVMSQMVKESCIILIFTLNLKSSIAIQSIKKNVVLFKAYSQKLPLKVIAVVYLFLWTIKMFQKCEFVHMEDSCIDLSVPVRKLRELFVSC